MAASVFRKPYAQQAGSGWFGYVVTDSRSQNKQRSCKQPAVHLGLTLPRWSRPESGTDAVRLRAISPEARDTQPSNNTYGRQNMASANKVRRRQ